MNLQPAIAGGTFKTAPVARAIGRSETFVEFSETALNGSVVSRFEQIARSFAASSALREAHRELSYAELNATANQLAHAILDHCGCEVGQVALLLESGISMVVGVLAACKAGKLSVPLDAAYPKARQSYMLENSEAALLVCNMSTLARAREITAGGVRVLNVDAISASVSNENPQLAVAPDNPCLLLYTSGSTGQPKGVVQTHRNVLHTCLSYTNTLGISADDCISHLHSTSFSAGITEVFWGILNGATVCVWDVRSHGFTGLRRWIADEEISILHWVPTSFRHLFKAEFAHGMNDISEAFPSARLLVLGSEAVTHRDVELWAAHFPADSLFICRLGSTEASNYRMFFVDRETTFEGTVVPVGYPFGGKEVLLLDNEGHAVGANEIGEIAIRSEYLSPGYWLRPDLTDASFLPDPQGDGKRIFLSGDLGIVRTDGRLDYLGRKDSQVKIRGQRVEIAEIEAALLAVSKAKQAAVTAFDDAAGEKYLAAYIVPTDSAPPLSAGVMRQALAERLPVYMIPAAFVMLDELPLTTNGKVDHKALPAPAMEQLVSDRCYHPPRSPLDLQIVKIWETILNRRPLGIQDNFFELGGHSLQAVQVLSQIKKSIGNKITIADLFRYPTVEQLSEVIRQNTESLALSHIRPYQTIGSKPPFFCIYVAAADAAHLVESDQPFYGGAPHGFDGKRIPSTVEAMVIDFIREIKAIQPQGTYFIGGYSFGGMLAFEIARRLQEQGEKIGLLLLLDPATNGKYIKASQKKPQPGGANAGAGATSSQLTNIQKKDGARTFQEKWRQIVKGAWRRVGFNSRMQKDLMNIFFSVIVRFGMTVPLQKREPHSLWRYRQLIKRYVPERYIGKAVLIRSSAGTHAPELFWRDYISEPIEVLEVPGNHLDIFKAPYVHVLAEKFKMCLEEAQKNQ